MPVIDPIRRWLVKRLAPFIGSELAPHIIREIDARTAAAVAGLSDQVVSHEGRLRDLDRRVSVAIEELSPPISPAGARTTANADDGLACLAQKYGTDKWGDHWYTRHYHRHFHHLRHRKINLLEIGVGGYDDSMSGGESLRMWREYFPQANIHGIDIHDKTAVAAERIQVWQGSQADEAFLLNVFRQIGSLDIVIDDGSHLAPDIIASFNILFPILNHDGIYVVEDLQTSYWPEFGGTSDDLQTADTAMIYFKKLLDCLNHEEFIKPGYRPSYFDRHITGVHFYHNLVFIEKGINDEGSNLVKNNIFAPAATVGQAE